ncbi:transposase [Actinacidiphila yanglinensis]|uniref:transposase n=1 Tax=Actinacidiphila yanglinensis TaxID=310779 RepID=UPI00190E9185|nr:transposase [Actinacidiphila yanglinensis]
MSVRWVISDAMWDRIEPLMPADPVRGRRWADHRRTLEAIAWKYRTGSPWRDLPDGLSSFQRAHKRLLRWAVAGTWERILAALLAAADGADAIDWTESVDSTVCRAHQHAAGAAAGQAGDAPAFEAVMAGIRVPRSGPGRPRTRPDAVLADRAYSSRAIREHRRRRGIRAVIPQPADQNGHRLRRGRAGGRPPGFDAEAYKQRNAVERCINRLKQWRGPALRTDQLAIAYQAALRLTAIPMWTRR